MVHIDLTAAVEFYKRIDECVNNCKGTEIGNTFVQIKKWIKTIFPDIEDYLDKEDELKLFGDVDYDYAKREYIYQNRDLERSLKNQDEILYQVSNTVTNILEMIFPRFNYKIADKAIETNEDKSD